MNNEKQKPMIGVRVEPEFKRRFFNAAKKQYRSPSDQMRLLMENWLREVEYEND